MIPLSLYVTFLLLKVSGLENYEDGIAGWIFVPFSIMFIFGLQWLILRRHISKATKWIWGNISALILGGLLIAVFSRFTTTTELPEWSLMAIPAISYGLLMGLAHWLIFKKYFSNVFFWIVLNCSASLLVVAMSGGSIHNYFEMALFGGVPAVFIGLALLRILRAERVNAIA
jgi:hypothetical protein